MNAHRAIGCPPASALPQVLPVRQQAEIVRRSLEQRLETVLPAAMRAAGLDMWYGASAKQGMVMTIPQMMDSVTHPD